MNAADSTPLSPQAHADLMDAARARAVQLRQQAKAEFVDKMIAGVTNSFLRLSKFFAQLLAMARRGMPAHRHTGVKG
jgi:hypothetical protein